jgi:peroxiredoxin
MRSTTLGFGLLLLIATSCGDKDNNSFTVKGKIKGASTDVIFLEEAALGSSQPLIVDSAKIGKDGSFELSTLAKEENLYVLRLTQQVDPVATVINDTKEVTIQTDLGKAEGGAYTVKGSPASQALIDYLMSSNNQLSSIYNMSVQLDSMQGMDSTALAVQSKRAAAVNSFTQYVNTVIEKSKSPSLSLFVVGSYQSYASNPALGLAPFTGEELTAIINKTTSRFPEHTGLASVKGSLAESAKAEQQQQAAAPASLLNKPAPAFTLPGITGAPIALSSYKGKYVLVDFWASWCAPCRKENPNVVQAYNRFKDKNFTILGVSLDKEQGPWKEAIKADGLTWAHASDLKFWESAVVPMYNIQGIPYNVLVDPNGIVIAENLRGPELDRKLSEVLR